MIKFSPNFGYCAVDQEKAVFKRKRAVSGPSALFGPGRPTSLGLKGFKLGRFLAEFPGSPGLQGPLPCECQQRSPREASGRGLRGPLKRTIWRMVRLGAGYSPAACRAYRAAHSCLWDWELCRPPEGFRLQSCLACRLRRVRPARRPRAHSV